MRKLTLDEERFKSCLKKSKSKTIHLSTNGTQLFWYFKDVEQTGWHPETITGLIKDDLIEIDYMVGGGAGVAVYRGISWGKNEKASNSSNRNDIRIWRSN